MNKNQETKTSLPTLLPVNTGEDLFAEHRSLGVSKITFKVTPQHENDVLIIENTFHKPGGPARHLHYFQDEWFYIVNGQFNFEVGSEKYQLKTGDSILAPRKVPHVWASIENDGGSILIAFLPAGKMVPFFREVTKLNAMPPLDPDLWLKHDMELLGPPLLIA